jgi:hypothetical protein
MRGGWLANGLTVGRWQQCRGNLAIPALQTDEGSYLVQTVPADARLTTCEKCEAIMKIPRKAAENP